MRFRAPGKFRSAEAFREHLRTVAPELDCELDLAADGGALARPLVVAGRTLSNRFAIHPMEGWDGTDAGGPGEWTLRRWRRFGRSGAKLIWGGEAFAVTRDGRANPHQLCANPDAAGHLAELLAEVRAGHREIGADPDELYVGLQLTHSGRFSRPTVAGPAPKIAFRHPVLDERFGIDADQALLTDAELEGIGAAYVAAARLARDAGFPFVDVKCCHGYLMHELLAARSRPGPYGGSFENRTRLFRRIVEAIRAECPELEIGVRVSIADRFPFTRGASGVGEPAHWQDHVPYECGFGVDPRDPCRFDLEEPLRFLELLQHLGIQLVNLTLGSPYYCPHLQRPAAYPPCDGYQPPRDPLADVAEHLLTTRAVKAAFPELVLVGTGYSYLQEYLPHVAAFEVGHGHVDLVGLGRMVLSYPELPRDVLAGQPLARKLICRTFSDCTTAPRNGLPSGCYPLDPEYRVRPEAAKLRAIQSELRDE